MAKSPRRPKITEQEQVFSIHTWRFDFTCAASEKSNEHGWTDDRQLKLFGEVEASGGDRLSEIWIGAQRNLHLSGKAVGAYGGGVYNTPIVILWMPADVIPTILQMVRSRRYRSVSLQRGTGDDGAPIVLKYAFSDQGPTIL